ncbi:MAG: MATE family efflux transporter [Bosea sp. (in: a-proteobacteria)]
MSAASQNKGPVFVTGSTMRHVAIMTGTGSVGLMAIFLVDLLSLLYVSWLGRPEATAGVGYATIVLFFAISFNIGLMIGITALMARRIGSGQRDDARRIGGSTIAIATLTGVLVSLALLPFLPSILTLIGAKGEAHQIALRFLWIVLPSNAMMSLGMGYSAALRAVGDASRAMYVTLAGGLAIAALDPLLIFGLGLGVDGAAIAVVISRIIFACVGWYGAVKVHDLVCRPRMAGIRQDALPLLKIAGPAILTNIATPVASAFVASIMSRFGDKAMAALAIIDRLTPVAFGALFAMSGAIGPILSQNWGAGRHDRMRRALTDAVVLAAAYVLIMWIILYAGRGLIADAFQATGLAAQIINWFVVISGPMWLALGALFVANASFNNLGFPLLATGFNWGRATIGAIPMAWLGAELDGPRGVLIGVAIGATVFGAGALVMAYRVIGRLELAAMTKSTVAETA